MATIKLKVMCNCINVEIGSYSNQEIVERPSFLKGVNLNESDKIGIDKCLLEEIKYLWSQEIRTTGCCCGHNKVQPYIGVIQGDIQKMIDLGYKVKKNSMYPKSRSSFYPKSV